MQAWRCVACDVEWATAGDAPGVCWCCGAPGSQQVSDEHDAAQAAVMVQRQRARRRYRQTAAAARN